MFRFTYTGAESIKKGYVFLHGIYMFKHLGLMVFLVAGIMYREQLKDYINQMFQFNKMHGLELFGQEYHPKCKRELFTYAIVGTIASAYVIITSGFVVTHRNVYFIYNVFLPPNHPGTGIWLLIGILFELYHSSKFGSNLATIIMGNTAYFCTSKFWLYTICTQWPKFDQQKFKDYGIKMYNRVGILNRLYNDAYCSLLIPYLSTSFCIMFTVGVYGIVRLHDTVDIIVFATVPLAVTISSILIAGSISIFSYDLDITLVFWDNAVLPLVLHETENRSSECSHSFKKWNRILMSRKPLKCEVLGSLYYMKKSTKMTLIGALINTSITLLITF